MPLLSVANLQVALPGEEGGFHAVRDVSLALEPGQKLGIVGESGSGKSMTALAIMRLLPERATVGGSMTFAGRDLLRLSEAEMCRIRGNDAAMIFQEPMTSLNPLHSVGRQIADPLTRHKRMSRAAARREAVRLLDRVGIPEPARCFDSYPHQLSGGQRQRVMIAIALSCSPSLLIADEPTTALDVTVQRQILDLIAELVDETGMALILISHDLGVIGEQVDEILVMYCGRVVEQGPTRELFERMAHPYTRGLFAAMPRLGRGRAGPLETIPGTVPDPADPLPGCAFADRCPQAIEACRAAVPPLVSVGAGHRSACIRTGALLAGGVA